MRCTAVIYCSRECQLAHWEAPSGHKKRCNADNLAARPRGPKWELPETRYLHSRWAVEDFQKGPDQPMDPPDTEEYVLLFVFALHFNSPPILFVVAAPASRYEYAIEMWRDRDFILGGKVVFSASFIDPEVRFHFIF